MTRRDGWERRTRDETFRAPGRASRAPRARTGLKWIEATATVLVDAKQFDEALKFYSVAIDA